jgi:hypothetical protein
MESPNSGRFLHLCGIPAVKVTVSGEIAKVCLYDERYAEAFGRFCRVIWPHSRPPASSPEASVGSPVVADAAGRRPPTFLFVKGEEVVGHVTTIPVRLATGAETSAAHWIVGFMVLPEYRNGLVGPLLIKEVNRVLDCALSLHVEPPVLRILTGLKWRHIGVLPQYLCVLNARGVMKNLQPRGLGSLSHEPKGWSFLGESKIGSGLVRWGGGIGLAFGHMVWRSLAFSLRPRKVHAEIREEHGFDESYTELWQSVAGRFKAALVRDQASLHERFERKMDRYRLLACRRGPRLMGYCIVKMKTFSHDSRMGNMKVGTVVDCLYDPEDPSILQSLIAYASRWFDQEGAHVIFCTASLSAVRRVLLANGFFRIPGNLNFAYYTRLPRASDQVPMEDWHLMRGDSDADQNF